MWNHGDGTPYAAVPASREAVDTEGIYTHVVFSPDSRTLAYSTVVDGLRLWDVAAREAGPELRGSSSVGTGSLAFNATGDLLAQGGVDKKVVLWDPAHPDREVAVLTGQTTAVFGVSFGPDNTLAAGGADDAGVLVWDLGRRTQQATLQPGTTGTEPFFLPGSDALLVADLGGLHLYDLATTGLHDRLCGLVGRDFTAAEWAAYVVGRDPEPLCAG